MSTHTKDSIRSQILLIGAATLLGLAALTQTACTSTAGAAAGASQAGPEAGARSGAELWQANCQRCHNFRSPASLSDAQWDVAVMHMRIRANLTAEETRAILAYLQLGN